VTARGPRRVVQQVRRQRRDLVRWLLVSQDGCRTTLWTQANWLGEQWSPMQQQQIDKAVTLFAWLRGLYSKG